MALALSACIKPPRHEPEVSEVPRPQPITPFPTPTHPPATATPTATETPTPTMPIAAAGTPTEVPSLVTRINNTTAPNVAAALRLVEEGRGLLDRQSYDPAQDRFERALAIDPTNAYGYYFLARLHVEKRNYGQAIAFADKSAVLAARDDKPLSARAYVLQGEVFEQVGRFPDARTAYRRALAADPSSSLAQSGMARVGGGAPAP
ncbi:MAG TPA: tetratricopeptide repeat protein [Candidatus Binatia bacterium]|nr:tetratricopeptide repeat protein [Candidatus Binatia bacterium]